MLCTTYAVCAVRNDIESLGVKTVWRIIKRVKRVTVEMKAIWIEIALWHNGIAWSVHKGKNANMELIIWYDLFCCWRSGCIIINRADRLVYSLVLIFFHWHLSTSLWIVERGDVNKQQKRLFPRIFSRTFNKRICFFFFCFSLAAANGLFWSNESVTLTDTSSACRKKREI